MARGRLLFRRLARTAMALGGLAVLSGCQENAQLDHSLEAIPNDTLALMQERGVTTDAPILIRSYKQESEFEVWKRKPDGRYVYIKTFPMCRWSGQLGPKRREGDRQSPEGFYAITPGQMNPNSSYYLSFNVGYPNAYDRAYGATGGNIMVHGICSSSGCFSMTNKQMGEIYALVREAFNGGQKAIQMQSLPFRMTAKNLAKHRFDPNMAFWRNLKEGADNFEVTKQEPVVGVCNKKYVFNALPDHGRFEASAPCPRLREDEGVKADVTAKQERDDAQVAALVTKGERAVQLVYVDGSQNPVFYNQVPDVSAPEGLTNGPTEVAMAEPAPDPLSSKTSKGSRNMLARNERTRDERARIARAPAGSTPVDTMPTSTVVAATPAAAPEPSGDQPVYSRLMGYTANLLPKSDAAAAADGAAAPAEKPLYQRMLGLGGADDAKPATVPSAAAATTDPTGAPAADKAAQSASGKHASAAVKSKTAAHAKRRRKRDDDVARLLEASPGAIGKDYMALSAQH